MYKLFDLNCFLHDINGIGKFSTKYSHNKNVPMHCQMVQWKPTMQKSLNGASNGLFSSVIIIIPMAIQGQATIIFGNICRARENTPHLQVLKVNVINSLLKNWT